MKCKRCGTLYKLGRNGTVHGCDKCTGAKRDKNGYWWMPTEDVQERQDLGSGVIYSITREVAFRDGDKWAL